MGPVIVLAAGASTRFGGVPKATLRVGNSTAVERIVRVAAHGGFSPAFVVVGAAIEPVSSLARAAGAGVVVNAAWHDGRTGSLKAGLEAAGDDRPTLVWPVDHPFADRATIARLRTEASVPQLAIWLIPTFDGRGGHPVVLTPTALRAVADLAAEAPLRSLIPRFGPQVRRVPVPDPGVVENIDTAPAYERALARSREDGWTDA